MNYLAVTLLLFIGACLGKDPVINGGNVTDAPVTEIDPPTSVNPETTTPATSTTSSTTPITSKPTTTTPKPTNPTTTSSPTPIPKPNSTTTDKPSTTSASPVTSTASPHHDRKFDGPSFVGGIILALGLVAIGFVAFKFYKARTELNYHTL